MRPVCVLGLAALLTANLSLLAGEQPAALFAGTRPADVPRQAARLVKAAKDQETATIQIVTAALKSNPAAAPLIVGAVSRALPAVAHLAAGTAAAEQPNQAYLIARSAAAGAPSKAAAITFEICKAAPAQVLLTAQGVLEAAPRSGKEVLAAIARAIPALASGIEQFKVEYRGAASVQRILAKACANTQTADLPQAALPVPPTVLPPFVELTGNAGTIPPSTGTVPGGGRNYAQP